MSLALKPGKPLAAGRIGATAVLALPGNPAAAMVGALLFARPMLEALAGLALTKLAAVAARTASIFITVPAGLNSSRWLSQVMIPMAYRWSKSSDAEVRRGCGLSSSPTGLRVFRPRPVISRRALDQLLPIQIEVRSLSFDDFAVFLDEPSDMGIGQDRPARFPKAGRVSRPWASPRSAG